MQWIAGVDSSTQSTKVEIRDLTTGELRARASAPHPATTPPRSEQDPHAWWSAFETAFAATGVDSVAAISVGGQQHGMVVLDKAGAVVRPAKLWNDTESADDAAWLLAQLPGRATAWAEAVGSVPVASFTVTKLSWLHRNEPDAWARVAHVLLPHDWLTYRLTGHFTTDRGDASGTGYWSPASGEYRFDILSIVDATRDWPSVVPTVLAPGAAAGIWNGAVVAPGTGDNMATALGLRLRPGDAVISLGTSMTAFAVSDRPVSDPTGAIAGFADATGHYLPLVCTLNGTKVLDATRRLLGVDHDEFDRLALTSASGAGGLTLLPYFDGERTPNLPDATGAIAGLRSDVTREQLARAAVEGVACHALDALDALRRHVTVDGRVMIVGGGARSAAMREVLAGLSDMPIEVVDADEAASAGACVQAASVLTGESTADIAERWGLGRGTRIAATKADASVRERYAGVRDAAN